MVAQEMSQRDTYIGQSSPPTSSLYGLSDMLQRTIWHAEEMLGGKLPDKLYVQLDNCWRENKNNAVINWLTSLVERGLFPGGVEIGFLPKGHTHNECDQCASRLAIACRHRDIECPSQLYAILRDTSANGR